ncbi:MAG: 4Fe-4S dicluster domain-containing protein, partial [Chloroflexi bacterium]|nr:4Fe-4S dicluster domain-containing protein [Chloroflexota bacterium]
MSTRGTTQKTDTPELLTLLRPMITRRYELFADHVKCCGCKICETVCPREAITLSEATLENGRVVAKARVDIDPAKCNFCGECVALCPTHALAIRINGEPAIPVVDGEAFPKLIRTREVNQEAFAGLTETAYIDECPTAAISADIEYDEAGNVVAVRDVRIDQTLCINCTHCQETGPKGAFAITKPYRGRIFLDISLCPAGCQACADVCPTPAIAYDGEKVSV